MIKKINNFIILRCTHLVIKRNEYNIYLFTVQIIIYMLHTYSVLIYLYEFIFYNVSRRIVSRVHTNKILRSSCCFYCVIHRSWMIGALIKCTGKRSINENTPMTCDLTGIKWRRVCSGLSSYPFIVICNDNDNGSSYNGDKNSNK